MGDHTCPAATVPSPTPACTFPLCSRKAVSPSGHFPISHCPRKSDPHRYPTFLERSCSPFLSPPYNRGDHTCPAAAAPSPTPACAFLLCSMKAAPNPGTKNPRPSLGRDGDIFCLVGKAMPFHPGAQTLHVPPRAKTGANRAVLGRFWAKPGQIWAKSGRKPPALSLGQRAFHLLLCHQVRHIGDPQPCVWHKMGVHRVRQKHQKHHRAHCHQGFFVHLLQQIVQ